MSPLIYRRADIVGKSPHPIHPSPHKADQTPIPQNLQLLPDFRADIPIQRMLRLQIGLERIHIGQRKFQLLDSLHTDQHIQQPAFGFDVMGAFYKFGLVPFHPHGRERAVLRAEALLGLGR